MTEKQRNEFIREIAKTIFVASVLDSSNHDRHSEIAARAVRDATCLADALPVFSDPEPDVAPPIEVKTPEVDQHDLHDK